MNTSDPKFRRDTMNVMFRAKRTSLFMIYNLKALYNHNSLSTINIFTNDVIYINV